MPEPSGLDHRHVVLQITARLQEANRIQARIDENCATLKALGNTTTIQFLGPPELKDNQRALDMVEEVQHTIKLKTVGGSMAKYGGVAFVQSQPNQVTRRSAQLLADLASLLLVEIKKDEDALIDLLNPS